MEGGACSCRRLCSGPPHSSRFELLDQPLACLPVLPLFPISLQSAARIHLLNYNSNEVIQQSINFLDSTLAIKLDKCIQVTFWILLNIIKHFLNVWKDLCVFIFNALSNSMTCSSPDTSLLPFLGKPFFSKSSCWIPFYYIAILSCSVVSSSLQPHGL